MRQAIQISVSASDEYGDYVYAVCDDGSVWMVNAHRPTDPDGEWIEITPIPGSRREFDRSKE